MSKILIVEDERIVAGDIETSLKRWGHGVSGIVSSGEEALKNVEITRPDLVLMDVKLKGRMDGVQTAHRLHEEFKIPVVYLTAHANDELLRRAQATESFGYIVKPFEEKSLHATIEMAVYKSQVERLDQERRQQLQKLTEATLKFRVNSLSSVEAVLKLITEQARDIIGTHQAVTVLTMENDWAKAIKAVSFSDKYPDWRGYRIGATCSDIFSLVCHENRPVCMTQEDLESHPEWDEFIKEKNHPPMRGLLGAPLVSYNHINMGLIYLTDKVKGNFSLEDGVILMQLAHMASSVIDNVHLYREAEEARVKTKQSEGRIQEAADALARSNQDLEQFAYVASHDLKEPLKVVNSFTQLLQTKYKGKVLDGSSERLMQHISEGVGKMTALVDNLLTYSRVGKSKAFQPISCTTCLEDALARLEVAIKESGAQVTYDPLPDISGDAIQMTQLFQNLIANAIKFRGEKPSMIHVSKEAGDGQWVISVRDSGIGIKGEDFDKIFEIFKRLPGPAQEGSGIGLAICKKIVEQHGGQLSVSSQPGEGSTFAFTLPMLKI
jgi:signal transduction histidine kinase/CheY-like chemotaxis protein